MKAGKFSMVSRSVWRSGRFKSLGSERAKLVYFYFLTCEHQNGLGCYRLPDGYAVDDLGWSIADYRAAKAECEAASLIRYDEETQEIFVEKWLQNNPAQNRKHLVGMAKAALNVESAAFGELLDVALAELDKQLQPDPPPRPGYR